MTNKYRNFFLNIIYLVLLVEVALNKDNINYEEYLKNYQKMNENNIKIKKEIENIEKKNLEYLQKINAKNVDYFSSLKIKEIIEKIKIFYSSVNETKEKLTQENGGYDKKNNIKNPRGKKIKKETLEEISELLKSSYLEITQPINKKISAEENEKAQSDSTQIKKKEEIEQQKSLGNVKKRKKIHSKSYENKNKKTEKKEEEIKKNSTSFSKKKKLIEFLLALEQKKNEILLSCLIELYEKEKEISQNKWDITSFDLIAVPEKKTIKEREPYKAQIFLVVKNEDKEIKINNTKIEKDLILFQPQQQNIIYDNNGLSKQSLNVVYDFKSPFNGKTISLEKKIEFSVSNKKDIEGQHAIVEALYKNCDNLYSVRNLDPETNNNISFSFEGGTYDVIKKENDRFVLVLVPNKDKCTLHILNSKKEIDKIDFNVREIGKPKIEVIVNNKVATENSILTAEDINDIIITSIANENFKDKFPNESHYEVQNFTILLCKDNKSFYTKEIKNNMYKFNAEEKRQLKKAEKLIIKTDSIKRFSIDSKNKKEITKENNIFSDGEIFSRTFILKTKEKDEDEDF